MNTKYVPIKRKKQGWILGLLLTDVFVSPNADTNHVQLMHFKLIAEETRLWLNLVFSALRPPGVSWPYSQAYCRGTGPQWQEASAPTQFWWSATCTGCRRDDGLPLAG